MRCKRVFVVAMLLVFAMPTILGSAAVPHGQGESPRPDIVLVLVDDMTQADWRSLPKTRARLPAVFPNYINVDPICCPSRASILRGQYPHSHGTLTNSGSNGGWESFRDQEGQTIAVELKSAGYRTGFIGKYLNGYRAGGGTPPGWSYWFARVKHSYFDLVAIEGKTLRTYAKRPKDYSTDIFGRKAIRFVNSTPRDQPLLAFVWPIAPHLPATPAPRHEGSCDRLKLGSANKPSFNESDMSDKPDYMQHAPLPVGELTLLDRRRQCSLKAVDDLVVKLVDALEARGRPYNLVFASDNGYLLGEHRRTKKAVPYEESIRTTMRATGPGFPTSTDERLVSNLDLAPTFASLAGIPPRADWDGRSLLAGGGLDRRLIGIEGFARDEVEVGENALPPQIGSKGFQGFRGADGTVYIEYQTGEIELYDLTADPYQLENLAKGKSLVDFPDHHARVEALRNCRAETCWTAEDAPLGNGSE